MLSLRSVALRCLKCLTSDVSRHYNQRCNELTAILHIHAPQATTLASTSNAWQQSTMGDLPAAVTHDFPLADETNLIDPTHDLGNEDAVNEDCAPENACDGEAASKKAAEAHPRDPLYFRRKKFAMIIGYCGTGYRGLQWAHGSKTIERDLFEAMAKANILPQTALGHPSNFNFQRCARTDKGVSAVSNIMSLTIATAVADHAKEYTNRHLPPQIRVFDVIRTTKGFNAKNNCDSRTYLYIMPTFALAPVEHTIQLDYRLPDAIRDTVIEHVNKLCAKYVGTKNFHNFTREVKPWEATGQRYIMDCKCSAPFVRDNIEFVQFTVRGQSFMMHQIRKMIGLIVAVRRDSADDDVFNHVFGACKVRVPKVPGLGLLLEQVHMDHYNQRHCDDGSHKSVALRDDLAAEVADFKESTILPNIARGEKEDLSMLTWLAELGKFKIAVREYVETKKAGRTQLGLAAWAAEDAADELADSSSEESSADDDDDTRVIGGAPTISATKDGQSSSLTPSAQAKETTRGEEQVAKRFLPKKRRFVELF